MWSKYAYNKSSMLDDRQAEKLINLHNSATTCPIATNFGILMQTGLLNPTEVKNLKVWNFLRIFKSPYLNSDLTDREKIWQYGAYWPS